MTHTAVASVLPESLGNDMKLPAFFALFLPSMSLFGAPKIETVPKVDLARYQGPWRVIACMDNSLERTFVDAVESYKLRSDGKIAVHFAWRSKSFDAPIKTHDMTARVIQDGTNARWKVRLFPLFAASYQIIDIDPQYSRVAVAHPSRKFGWILARDRTVPESTYRHLLEKFKAQGFDTSKFIKVPQVKSQPRQTTAKH